MVEIIKEAFLMKKILALLLAVICLFSVLTVGLTAAAEDDNQDPIYAIVYEKGGVSASKVPAGSQSRPKSLSLPAMNSCIGSTKTATVWIRATSSM